MAGWGDYMAKTGLVEQVKEWQRRSPGHKKAWDNYCHENGHPKFDPNLKDEAFLQGFLEGANSGYIAPTEESMPIMTSGGDQKTQLVEQVKSIQRQGQGYKQAWWKFCRQNGSQDFDPMRHDDSTLSMFVSGVQSGTIQPCEDDGGYSNNYSKGGSQGGKGGKGNDWWSDPWSMDPWQMMMMMKGKMGMKGGGGKGSKGGKGGGGTVSGEIRYDDPNHTQQALQMLNGSSLKGSSITVEMDPKSQDGTKLTVSGIPAGLQWQELKDHFSPIGTVAYAGVKDSDGGGGGGKGGGGGDWMQAAWQMMSSAKGKGYSAY